MSIRMSDKKVQKAIEDERSQTGRLSVYGGKGGGKWLWTTHGKRIIIFGGRRDKDDTRGRMINIV